MMKKDQQKNAIKAFWLNQLFTALMFQQITKLTMQFWQKSDKLFFLIYHSHNINFNTI